MSAAVSTRPAGIPETAQVRFRHVLRAELVKLTSLRSTIGLLATIVVAGLGSSLALALTMESAGLPSGPSPTFTLWTVSFGVVFFGQLVAAVLGVLAMSGEYSSGTIQSALVAVPNRLLVLAAKTVAVFTLVTTAGLVTTFGSWLLTYPFFDSFGLATGLDAPGFALALIGAAAYIGLTAVFALGVSTVLRSAAGGIATVFGVLLLVPMALSIVGGSSELVAGIWPYLLSNAGEAMGKIAEPVPGDGSVALLGPLAATLTVLGWTVVSLGIGALALRRRDA